MKTTAMKTASSQLFRRAARIVPMLAVCIALALGAVWSGPAWGQDARALADRLDRLERSLTLLQRSLYRGEEPPAEALAPIGNADMPAPSAARLHIRVSDLEELLRQLTGQIEEVGFGVRQMTSRLDKLVADMDFRLRSLEQTAAAPGAAPGAAQMQLGMAPPVGAGAGEVVATPQFPSVRVIGQVDERRLQQVQAGGPRPAAEQVAVAPLRQPVAPAPAPQAAPGPGPVQQQGLPAAPQAPAAQMAALPAATPEAQYEFAYGLLIRRDIPSAEVALAEFVGENPDHPLAGNAQYWLGETYYVRQDFMAAARTFAEGYSRYPKSGKAPDNLLKLAMSLNALGRKDDACITFTKLIDEYPGATVSVRRRAERERGLLACS